MELRAQPKTRIAPGDPIATGATGIKVPVEVDLAGQNAVADPKHSKALALSNCARRLHAEPILAGEAEGPDDELDPPAMANDGRAVVPGG